MGGQVAVDGARPWSGDRTLYLDRIALRLHRLITSMYALFVSCLEAEMGEETGERCNSHKTY